tara:strand:- start:3617 stop:4003 length:387 start_codon:yes stop_codon:yes gene_type:complete
MAWWDVTNVEDYKNKCFRPAEKYEDSDDGYVVKLTTERVIYACEAVKMSGIKPDNVDEFYTRYLMYSRAIQRGSKEYLTLQDIEAHVGIQTGVDTKSRQHFDKTISEIMRDKAEWRVNYEREKAEGEE